MSVKMSEWKKRALIAALATATAMGVGACGGGGGGGGGGEQASGGGSSAPAPSPSPIPSPTPTPTPAPAPAGMGEAVASVSLVSESASAGAFATFGQVFKPGDVPAGSSLEARVDGAPAQAQVDWKATHADGSLRHAVISVRTALGAGRPLTVELARAPALARPARMSVESALAAGLKASVKATIGGVAYTASLEEAMGSGSAKAWLSGPVASEWLVKAPFKTASGQEHPHLTARFAARVYGAGEAMRVDAAVENNWAYEPNPQGFTYDAELWVGGKLAYAKAGLSHFRQARWRKIAWIGQDPGVSVKHDSAYLMASRAIPNYDAALKVSEATLGGLEAQLSKANNEPMGNSLVTPYMPTTGGRDDIGPLPRWAALYVVTQDERAKKATLAVGDSAGGWPIHYRDKKTDLPLSVRDWPYATLLGNPGDTVNPKTKLSEAFPKCVAECGTAPVNFSPDTSHQPSMAYAPYLATGDYFYLEELQFWAAYNAFVSNPYYREFEKGLLKPDQIRGQAWSLRTLAQAAYITPDAHPMKAYFNGLVESNLANYNESYASGAGNALGALTGVGKYAFNAMVYGTPAGAKTGLAPWQDDFFTWAVGYARELGFERAGPIYAFKSKFPIGRMTDPQYCWIDGGVYAMAVRSSEGSPIFSTFGEAWRETFKADDGGPLVNSSGARYVDQACGSQAQADWRTQQDKDSKSNRNAWVAGEMTGYATATAGYPANMQPALALAADSGVAGGKEAWAQFERRERKPDYATAPQWAIVPRGN